MTRIRIHLRRHCSTRITSARGRRHRGAVAKYAVIILEDSNTPEFAAGASTFNKVAGITRNPWNTDYNSGGSSEDSAAALASGMLPLATGNDLGGSLHIRRASARWSASTSPGECRGGPTSSTGISSTSRGPWPAIGDIALMLDVTAGPHRCHLPAGAERRSGLPEGRPNPSIKNFRVAWSDNLGLTRVDTEVLKIARSSMTVFEKLGLQGGGRRPRFGPVKQTALTLRG